MTDKQDPEPPSRPTLRTLVGVGAWGAITTVLAYLISRGNIPIFIVAMLVIGVLQRVIAVRIARQRGDNASQWWKI